MGNNEQLQDLKSKAEKLAARFDSEPASNAAVAELAQIVADLAKIVQAHVYRNDDPAMP